MRHKHLLAILLSLWITPLANACEPLEGAWQLVYAVYKNKEGEVVYEIKEGGDTSLKILSQQHFTFITQNKDNKFIVAGAGTWSTEGNTYTEIVNYASLDRLMGKTYRFQCQLKDGMWIHTGDEDGTLIEEHWKPAQE
jgi:hypothetical protein